MNTQHDLYSNGKITVNYIPKKCIHAGRCARELSEVFRSSVIPWIYLEGTETERIIQQINRCPSGALQYHLPHKEAI